MNILSKMFSGNNPNRPIKVDSQWNPGKKLVLLSYNEAIKSLKSGDEERMEEALNHITTAASRYNEISKSLKSKESLIAVLVQLMDPEKDKHCMRRFVPLILGKIGDKSIVPDLEAVIKHDDNEFVVDKARESIIAIKSRG